MSHFNLFLFVSSSILHAESKVRRGKTCNDAKGGKKSQRCFTLVFCLVMVLFFPWLCCRSEQFDYYKTVLTGDGATPFSNPTSKDSISKNLGRTITIEMTNYHWISRSISPSGPPVRV